MDRLVAVMKESVLDRLHPRPHIKLHLDIPRQDRDPSFLLAEISIVSGLVSRAESSLDTGEPGDYGWLVSGQSDQKGNEDEQ